MRRRTKAAVVITALGALSLSAYGANAADTTRTANVNTDSAVAPESASWHRGTVQANKRIMERFTSEFLPTGDPEMAKKFLSPDIVMHFAGTTHQGRDTYLGIVAASMRAFPDLKWTVEDMRAEGDTVAIRYTMTGTHEGPFAGVEGTGRKVHAESFAFYRLTRGKIVEERAQLDMLTILQQMGAIPAA
ncbi:ester cyclase [Streptomyces sp. NPDC048275]|uniref:ester cyclase n=1 Tax=Streptomyces sp. NPDC048275 TaxID=3155629 RepID=UPI0033DE9ACD